MKRLSFYITYALRSLLRDQVRTLLAMLSVTFGVLSLVAMYLLANALLDGSLFDQRLQFGGDAQILPMEGQTTFTTADLQQIADWQQQNLIASYTPVAQGSAQYIRTPNSGRVTFLAQAVGIDPQSYPLVGTLMLREPVGQSAAAALQQVGDVLVTRDLADQLGLKLGATILIDGDNAPFELTIAGIVATTPAHIGDSLFYTLETARHMANRDEVVTAVSINWGTVADASTQLIASPYRVFVAADREDTTTQSNTTSLFDLMLKGAGILGLLVGGISVSNTLQVILARRKLEIAMLKTLGCQRGDLLLLMGIETGIIGLVGGLIGTACGALITGKLLDILAGSGSLMLDWTPDPLILVGGVLIGIVTAVVFGLQAILVASATRPIELLRDLPLILSYGTQFARLLLYGLLVLIFGLFVGLLVGSISEGVLYVAGGSIVLLLLRTIFWIILWGILAIPLPLAPLLRLARASLRQRKVQSSLALIALFAGAFSVTFAALIIYNARVAVQERRGSDEGYNLMVFTTSDQLEFTTDVLNQHGAQSVYAIQQATGSLADTPILVEARQGNTLNMDMIYRGTWEDTAAMGLLPDDYSSRYTVGDVLSVTINGQTQTVTLAGFYTSPMPRMDGGGNALIVPSDWLATSAGTALQTRVFGMFPIASLDKITTELGNALPTMLVISRADLNDWLNMTLQSLFAFAVSIAGLAFVAGAVLIANSAGLTVVERRREIGVFKAVGYTSGQVLRLLLTEYGLLGLLAGFLGIVGASAALLLLDASQPAANLTLEPFILFGMLVLSVSIALLSAAVVAWQPAHVRPLAVLRYE